MPPKRKGKKKKSKKKVDLTALLIGDKPTDTVDLPTAPAQRDEDGGAGDMSWGRGRGDRSDERGGGWGDDGGDEDFSRADDASQWRRVGAGASGGAARERGGDAGGGFGPPRADEDSEWRRGGAGARGDGDEERSGGFNSVQGSFGEADAVDDWRRAPRKAVQPRAGAGRYGDDEERREPQQRAFGEADAVDDWRGVPRKQVQPRADGFGDEDGERQFGGPSEADAVDDWRGVPRKQVQPRADGFGDEDGERQFGGPSEADDVDDWRGVPRRQPAAPVREPLPSSAADEADKWRRERPLSPKRKPAFGVGGGDVPESDWRTHKSSLNSLDRYPAGPVHDDAPREEESGPWRRGKPRPESSFKPRERDSSFGRGGAAAAADEEDTGVWRRGQARPARAARAPRPVPEESAAAEPEESGPWRRGGKAKAKAKPVRRRDAPVRSEGGKGSKVAVSRSKAKRQRWKPKEMDEEELAEAVVDAPVAAGAPAAAVDEPEVAIDALAAANPFEQLERLAAAEEEDEEPEEEEEEAPQQAQPKPKSKPKVIKAKKLDPNVKLDPFGNVIEVAPSQSKPKPKPKAEPKPKPASSEPKTIKATKIDPNAKLDPFGAAKPKLMGKEESDLKPVSLVGGDAASASASSSAGGYIPPWKRNRGGLGRTAGSGPGFARQRRPDIEDTEAFPTLGVAPTEEEEQRRREEEGAAAAAARQASTARKANKKGRNNSGGGARSLSSDQPSCALELAMERGRAVTQEQLVSGLAEMKEELFSAAGDDDQEARNAGIQALAQVLAQSLHKQNVSLSAAVLALRDQSPADVAALFRQAFVSCVEQANGETVLQELVASAPEVNVLQLLSPPQVKGLSALPKALAFLQTKDNSLQADVARLLATQQDMSPVAAVAEFIKNLPEGTDAAPVVPVIARHVFAACFEPTMPQNGSGAFNAAPLAEAAALLKRCVGDHTDVQVSVIVIAHEEWVVAANGGATATEGDAAPAGKKNRRSKKKKRKPAATAKGKKETILPCYEQLLSSGVVSEDAFLLWKEDTASRKSPGKKQALIYMLPKLTKMEDKRKPRRDVIAEDEEYDYAEDQEDLDFEDYADHGYQY